jgi:hypothetical protein
MASFCLSSSASTFAGAKVAAKAPARRQGARKAARGPPGARAKYGDESVYFDIDDVVRSDNPRGLPCPPGLNKENR